MKLLIVRHGDPDYFLDSLTDTGWKEAEILSTRLSRLDIKAFYCSPLGRAKDTASFTLKAMNAEAEILPWLREFSPELKGEEKPIQGTWDWFPEEWTSLPLSYDKDHWLEHPNYEKVLVSEEYNKVAQGLDALLAKHGYHRDGNIFRTDSANEDTIVLFCHFGLECVLLSQLLGISPILLWHGTCALPSSVTTLVTEERHKGIAYFRMTGFGDISHLYAAGADPVFSGRFCETYNNTNQRH